MYQARLSTGVPVVLLTQNTVKPTTTAATNAATVDLKLNMETQDGALKGM